MTGVSLVTRWPLISHLSTSYQLRRAVSYTKGIVVERRIVSLFPLERMSVDKWAGIAPPTPDNVEAVSCGEGWKLSATNRFVPVF